MSSGLTSGAPGRRAKRQRPRRTWGIWLIISIGVTVVVTGHWWSDRADTETLAPGNSRSTETPSVSVPEPRLAPTPRASAPATPGSPKTTEPPAPISRSAVVSVFNNTRVTGHAARVADGARASGWQVSEVGNWRGSVPASTVYFPASLKDQATILAKDLAIARVRPVNAGMSATKLTVVLVS